jgi:hypothetical protein
VVVVIPLSAPLDTIILMESISACKSMKFLMVIMQMISLINLLRNPNAMRITGMFIPLVSLKDV